MNLKLKALCSLLVAVGIAFITLQSASAAEQNCPKGDLPLSGTIKATAKTVGFIVGIRWGEGTLTLNDGSQHKFTFEGAKLVETGASKITITGNVYNLQRLKDFSGDYGAVSMGLTVVKGITGGVVLSNDECVYINAKAESKGLKLSAPAPGGVLVKFE